MNTDCSDKHTPCPEGYVQKSKWARKMIRTHYQTKCSVCGLYAIWVKRESKVKETAQ